jgi:hypothetical protein
MRRLRTFARLLVFGSPAHASEKTRSEGSAYYCFASFTFKASIFGVIVSPLDSFGVNFVQLPPLLGSARYRTFGFAVSRAQS